LAALSPEIIDEVVQEGRLSDRSLSHFISDFPLNWREQGSMMRQA
jgi:hypothetical protein